ncbi:MAG TPA: DUF4352 domain-containing protein [Dehalococcoidia bacterium]|nr:DUF4352 domain-containing protein [Dehalococcoidia bacterium]
MANLESRLRDLEKLKERGTITDEEYERKRATIIDEDAGRKGGGVVGTVLKGGAIGCLSIVGGFILLIVVIVAIIAIAAGGSGGENDDVRVAYSAGSSGTVETAGSVINRVIIDEIYDPAPADSQLFQPDEGFRCIALDITIENAGERETTGGDFLLRARDGFEYDPEFLKCAGASELNLLLQSLTSGGRTNGTIAFHVPLDAEVDWLKFDPNTFAKGDLYFDAP